MKVQNPPDTVQQAAELLLRRFGPHAAALMAYGSRVCGQVRAGSAFDFWLIVRDPEAFHRNNAELYRAQLNIRSTPEKQIALNRAGPLFYGVNENGMDIKFAVVGEEDFVRLCRDEWWTVKGRMQKPLRIMHGTPAVDAAILVARKEGLLCGLNLVPRKFTLEQLLYQIVGLSYRAEVRPEHKPAKIRSIVEFGRAELERIYVPLLQEVEFVAQRGEEYFDRRSVEERKRARAATLRALWRSKWSWRSAQYLWRNYSSHRAPIRYVLRKILGEIEKAVRRCFGRSDGR